MFLSNQDIRREIQEGHLIIQPFYDENVQPASVDLILGEGFLILDESKHDIIRLDEKPIYIEYSKGPLVLSPGGFALGTTLESVVLPDNIQGIVEGRSSIGRRGLFVQNAGFIDPGFKGNITLEFYNGNKRPIELVPGSRICQINFGYLSTPANPPYHGKYSGQIGTTGSRSQLDKEYR
jgi:dCTP deaminase